MFCEQDPDNIKPGDVIKCRDHTALDGLHMLYSQNEDFRAYVDKYMAKEQIGLQTALSHRIVQSYAEYLMERGAKEIKLPNMWGSAGAAHENVAEI